MEQFFKISNPEDWVVWLDLDDTVWDFKHNSDESLGELYQHLKLNRFWNTAEQWKEHYHRINSDLWALYSQALVSRDKLRHDRFFNPFTEAGMRASEAEGLVAEADRYYLERLGCRERLVPGAKALIERLVKRGFRLGILSNGFKEVQYNKLRSSRIENFFEYIVLSDEIDINKPDPAIFSYAEQKAAVDSEHCIMIGDNPDTDITGALKSGWYAIWFHTEGSCSTMSDVLEKAQRNKRLFSVSSLNDIEL